MPSTHSALVVLKIPVPEHSKARVCCLVRSVYICYVHKIVVSVSGQGLNASSHTLPPAVQSGH